MRIVSQKASKAALLVIFPLASLWAADAAMSKLIDTEHSALTVRVYKGGFLSAFGHEHEIRAPIQTGTFNEDNPAVDFAVDARKLQVRAPDVSDKDRTEIQATMLGPKVLDSEKFPDIRFLSTQVDRLGGEKWVVHGDLTLHGETLPVKVEVEGQNGHYRGSAQLRQKDFGITPVTVAGGTIKVKNEVRVEFEIVGK